MHVEEIVARLNSIADAGEGARAAGLAVSLPPALREACAEIIRLAAEQETGAAGAVDAVVEDAVAPDPLYALMPLRRLLWDVIEPGERVAVPVVVDRLAELGRTESAAAVSNALGYWVRRDRLAREGRGVYVRPPATGRR